MCLKQTQKFYPEVDAAGKDIFIFLLYKWSNEEQMADYGRRGENVRGTTKNIIIHFLNVLCTTNFCEIWTFVFEISFSWTKVWVQGDLWCESYNNGQIITKVIWNYPQVNITITARFQCNLATWWDCTLDQRFGRNNQSSTGWQNQQRHR